MLFSYILVAHVPVRPLPERHDLPHDNAIAPHIWGRGKLSEGYCLWCCPADWDLASLHQNRKQSALHNITNPDAALTRKGKKSNNEYSTIFKQCFILQLKLEHVFISMLVHWSNQCPDLAFTCCSPKKSVTFIRTWCTNTVLQICWSWIY